MMEVSESPMSLLATELLEQILGNLELVHLLQAQLVCKRWAEIVARQHFIPFLSTQDWSVKRQLQKEGWHESSHWIHTCRLIRVVFLGIPKLWEGRSNVEDQSQIEDKSGEQLVLLGEGTSPEGDVGDHQLRVAACAVFRDKLYLACSEQDTGVIRVFCLASLAPLPSLLPPSSTGEVRAPEGLLPAAPELAQFGSTLATTSPCRRQVWLYDCLTDVLVGQVTLAGPVYSLALGPSTLVALAGWAVHHWTLDSFNPTSVSLTFQASFLDLPTMDGGRSWLEAHSALLSRDYLVTRATQLLGAPATAACYLQVRRVCSVTGVISPSILRPESSALSNDVLEMSDMALSRDGLLATLTMERRDGTPRYVVRIQDCNSGDQLAVLPQTDILASVQVPVCWLDGQLYMKEVPRSLVASADRQAEFIDEDFLVSLSKWCPHSGETTHFPRPTFLSSSALLCVETARLTLVTSEMAPSLHDEATFQNSIRVCHFWPKSL